MIAPYFGAIAFVGTATLVRWCMDPILRGRQPFAAYIVAILLSGQFCGFKPSLLAVLLSGLATRFFFLAPRGTFSIETSIERGSFWFFCALGIVITCLMRAQQQARDDAKRKTDAALEKQHELEREMAERERAERHLKESEERFRLLAMSAPVGISLSDIEGRAYFVNPKLCEMAGAAGEQLLQHGWRSFLHPDDFPRVVDSRPPDGSAANASSSSEFRFIRSDGSVRWASSSVSVIRDANGLAIGQIGITQDITEQKEAENKLRTRESQLSGILDNAAAVIYLKDREGRYLLANRQMHTLFVHDGVNVIDKTDAEVFPESIARHLSESDAKVWQEQVPIDFEEFAPHADGLHTYRSVKFPVRDETGQMIALGGISTDVSDLKKAHDALKSEQNLLRDLIDVQENEKRFLCHEFHDGLLQYATGSLMLLEGYQSAPPAMRNMNVIAEVIGHLQKGVDDGRRVIRGIRPAVLDDSGLEAAIDDLIEQHRHARVAIRCTCNVGVGPLPNSLQTAVYRIVQEALNNAIHHSGSDIVHIELYHTAADLHLECRDTGCGFDPSAVSKRGFGLLGITERARLLHGECRIESQPGQGTRISVRLPISQEELVS